jgi:hypothetical protein
LLEKDYEFFHARLDKASCRNKEVVAFILKGFLCLGYIGGAMLFFNVSALALPWECKALLLLGASICGVSMLTKDEVQRGKEFLENIGTRLHDLKVDIQQMCDLMDGGGNLCKRADFSHLENDFRILLTELIEKCSKVIARNC